MSPVVCVLILTAFVDVLKASRCYSPPSYSDFTGPLYPLDPYGLAGHYSGFWSNYTENYTIDNLSFQVWLLSYDSSTPKSFYLSLVAIRNPSKLWDLVNPFIVWTANLDRPVNHGTARLEFGRDGNLKLLDDGAVAWETKTANKGVVSMCIVDDASIVLRNDSGGVLWQSIDEPTDTLQLQTAFLRGTRLVSLISPKNFSRGQYSLVMENNGLALYFASQPYWIFSFSGENNTKSLLSKVGTEEIYSALCWQSDGTITLDLRTNLSEIGDVNIVGNDVCMNPAPNDRRMLLPVNGTNFTYATFVRLTDVGDLVLYSWSEQKDLWTVYFSFSSLFSCFLPGQCGAFHVCDKTTSKCRDSCPAGFTSENGECELEEEAQACSPEDDTFIEVPGSDYFPTKFVSPQSLSEEECRKSCILNCSCKAVFYKENACFQTHADVQSLGTGDYLALLRVTDSRKMKERNRRALGLRIGLGILVPVLVILCGCGAWRLRKANEYVEEDEEVLLELSQRTSMPKRYTYRQLQDMTNDFSQCLGNGGFGSVFVGKLADGIQVAVKKLEGSNQRSRDFFAEVAVLATTHHWNLVRLLGFCAEGPSRRLLIYEYMVHGSLEKWIFQSQPAQSSSNSLTWQLRFDIALGTARGLSYLHEQCDEKIIHLDLKPENVLLDNSLQPKIADFGLSRLMNRDESYLQMTTIRGTPGYVAPEILQEGTVTEKSDVYSFGVLLLEIISGYRNKHLPSSYLDGTQVLNNGKQEKRLRMIAFLCIQDNPDARPSMSKVLQMMEGLVEVPDAAPSPLLLHFFLSNRLRVETSSNVESKTSSLGFTTSTLLKSSF